MNTLKLCATDLLVSINYVFSSHFSKADYILQGGRRECDLLYFKISFGIVVITTFYSDILRKRGVWKAILKNCVFCPKYENMKLTNNKLTTVFTASFSVWKGPHTKHKSETVANTSLSHVIESVL